MGVRSNAVNPSTTITQFHLRLGMSEENYEQYKERAIETHPLGRAGTSDDMAKAIVFLADDEQSSFITGTCLLVDGGKAILCPR